jgi:cyanophycin synthetase
LLSPKKILILLLFVLIYPANSDSLKVLFIGDTYFGESYQIKPGQNAINEYGYDYFFENVKDILLSSDLAIANLETPLANANVFIPHRNKEYFHFADKDSTPIYLSKYHINSVSVANNHILDLGYDGLNLTISSLNSYDVQPFGAGFNQEQASAPFSYNKSGVETNIFVFGCYWYRTRFDSEKHIYASGDKAGVCLLDPDKISAQIKTIKENYPDAFFIVYPHWGSNYKQKNSYQTETAHRLIDAGVDLIIGQGAHTAQEIEYYNGKWILYNIGNFIFNSPGRYGSNGAEPYGLMAELNINSNSKYLKLYPINTNNEESDYRVRKLDKNEFDECYKFVVKKDKGKVLKNGTDYFEIGLN